MSRRREFHGALIKLDDGIGCLHPWPEFGDAPIDEQLKLLRDGGASQVIERALRMAAVDGAARRRGVSLFAGLEIPLSHYSWDQNQGSDSQAQRLIDEGWQAIKMKGSAKLAETIAVMDTLVERTGKEPDPPSPTRSDARTSQVQVLDASLKIRVDFNSCLTGEQFSSFLENLPPRVRQRLDFVEDPFPYDAGRWLDFQRRRHVRLALDKQARGATQGFDVAVMKPGRREWRETVAALPLQTRIVMTSAMDHAIGQSFAAYEAAIAWRELGERMELCGLCTEHLFEENPFFERLRSRGGSIEVDRHGTGLGFDEVLEKLPWKAL